VFANVFRDTHLLGSALVIGRLHDGLGPLAAFVIGTWAESPLRSPGPESMLRRIHVPRRVSSWRLACWDSVIFRSPLPHLGEIFRKRILLVGGEAGGW
jgi:hypothetical protein